jgi:hypothetical protein
MAATATAPPRSIPRPRGQRTTEVVQPPRVIHTGPGQMEDVTGLGPDELYEAITTRDFEQWDYARLSAETGRSVVRLRKWVMNYYAVQKDPTLVPDDKTFIEPDGYMQGSPWWYAHRARKCLNQIGVMTRDGRMIPYKPAGRPRGSADRAPRHRWTHAPVRDTAAEVLQTYRVLTARPHSLSDSEARAELCRRLGLTRFQLNRRINAGIEAEAAKAKATAGETAEVDNAALRTRFLELVAELVAAGASERQADNQARDRLAADTGLGRRRLAARIAAARQAAENVTGKG